MVNILKRMTSSGLTMSTDASDRISSAATKRESAMGTFPSRFLYKEYGVLDLLKVVKYYD
jgi:hypothetical protein